jgi:poly-gamma-glutamate capsule biosynthesis protein CapA/YwtB (metallophosphatase superfamily)
VLPRHEREIAEAISTARREARTVIVLPHWGDEGSTHVNDEQQRWASWFVEQGADAVIGSGPHVIQRHETIAGVPVFYSVGNLWFSGPWPANMRVPGLAFLGIDAAGRVVATRLERWPRSGMAMAAESGRKARPEAGRSSRFEAATRGRRGVARDGGAAASP